MNSSATINNRNGIIVPLAKVTFSNAERDFLARNEACRLATCTDNIPHVVPVSYVFEDGAFYIAAGPEPIRVSVATAAARESGQN